MKVRVGINGFGRIGRNIMRAAMENHDIDFVAVNDLTNASTLAHLLKYDSVLGNLHAEVKVTSNGITVDYKEFQVLSIKDPAQLPWQDLGVDVVFESTGLFANRDAAAKHLTAGAKKVIITAPAKNPDITVVLGVNDNNYNSAEHQIISNASCTTNCLAPMAKVLHENFGFNKGWMTTVHSYTNDQKVLDIVHEDLRRGRAAALNIIPTSTGAARAVGVVLPDLNGKIHGMAMRVPTATVSVTDFVANLNKAVSVEEINQAYKDASTSNLAGILDYTDEPLVSSDFKLNPHSAIIDGLSTMSIGGSMVKVLGWYDNEWGYSCRTADLAAFVTDKGL